VVQGLDFLDRVRTEHEQPDVRGEDVVVVGGGNTAMDAARSALRLGAGSVRVLYRRTRAEMPAIAEEVREALEEGVEIDFLTQPVGLQRMGQADGDLGCWHVVCRRMELGEAGADGRRRPVEVPGSDFAVSCHRVILALGQSPDISVFPEGTEVREGEELLGILERPVYAVGDLATGAGTVARALGSGRRAALHIHQTLTGELVVDEHRTRVRSDVDEWHDEVIREDALRLHLFEKSPSASPPAAELERRVRAGAAS